MVRLRVENKEEERRGKELREKVGREGKREEWGSPEAREGWRWPLCRSRGRGKGTRIREKRERRGARPIIIIIIPFFWVKS